MTDFRHLVPNIQALATAMGCDYSYLHGVLKGATSCSTKFAKRIEAHTSGAVKAVWILGLEVCPEHQPSSSERAIA